MNKCTTLLLTTAILLARPAAAQISIDRVEPQSGEVSFAHSIRRQHVERDAAADVPDVGQALHGGPAEVDGDMAGPQWREIAHTARQSVIEPHDSCGAIGHDGPAYRPERS